MPVTIAPSTRAKLLRITARDLHPPGHDPLNLEEMLTAAAVLRPSSGRFWDSESESECEDLGDPCRGCAISDGFAVGAGFAATPESVYAAAPGEASMEIPVEGPFATRKILPAGNPGGLSAAYATDCKRARRRRGVDYGSRSIPAAGSKFGTRRARCAGHGPPPGSRPG
jgi:hypothetical protein